MEIRQILLVLTRGALSQSAVRLAARLADEHGAKVEGVCVFHEPAADPADCFAIGPEGVGDVLRHRKAKIDEVICEAAAAFRGLLADKGLAAGWTVCEIDQWSEAALRRAHLADLVVVDQPGHDSSERRLVEDLILRGGTPCLLAPPEESSTRGFERVILAWNGSAQAKRAMDASIPLLRRALAVDVVIATGESAADQADAVALIGLLARHDVQAGLVHLDAKGVDAGRAILEDCKVFDADLLVMGAFGHSRASEIILGGATRTVLTSAHLPVLFAH